MRTAEKVTVDVDEDGLHLLLEDDEGRVYDFNVQGIAGALEREVRAKVTPYLDEGGREPEPQEREPGRARPHDRGRSRRNVG